jgi:hypothetical protein
VKTFVRCMLAIGASGLIMMAAGAVLYFTGW